MSDYDQEPGKAEGENKKRVLCLNPFCQAPGFSGVFRQGGTMRCIANFKFRHLKVASLIKRFHEKHGAKSWFR